MRRTVFPSLMLMVATAALGQEAIPVGEEFQISDVLPEVQQDSALAAQPGGGFIVVWETDGSPGTDSDRGIVARRFDARGMPIGDEFQVNTYTTLRQGDPAIASDRAGNFIVVWTSQGSTGDDDSFSSVAGQRFASDGTAIGGEFQVNTVTTSSQDEPKVASSSEGEFVVVWTTSANYPSDIAGQRFTSEGTPIGGEFQINVATEYYDRNPDVAFDEVGDFLVVWSTGDIYSFTSVIVGRSFAADGTPLGDDFVISRSINDLEEDPDVSYNRQGNFVVAWSSEYLVDTGEYSFRTSGRRLEADGTLLGTEFQISAYTTESSHVRPAVANDSSDGFVVTWEATESVGDDNIGRSIAGRLYDGNDLGGEEFQVNSSTNGSQVDPALLVTPTGMFATWTNGQTSLTGQRFALQIFADGFESGDSSAWDNTYP